MTQEPDCRNCAHFDLALNEYPCNECEETYDGQFTKWESQDKPQTNADYIRSMSDEELADMLEGERGNMLPGTALNWLQQPYEEEDHEHH